ncbi:MAG: hypothetical protein RR416_03260 [Clostridia bacterium]
MQKDPYLTLGVDSNATQEQIENAYQQLKAKFSELRFEEGDVGNEATRRLSEIEVAHQACMDNIHQSISYSNYGSGYADIEQIIKDGKIEEAQSMLDKIDNRDGDWHYLQAIIYYKRNWNVESKKQLEIALALEPNNEKYTKALDNLKTVLAKDSAPVDGANSGAQGGQQDNAGGRAGYSRPNNQGGGMDATNACCTTCQTLVCLDCCCDCFGGGNGCC